MQLQLNSTGDKSRQRGSSLPLTLTDCPASFSVAQALFEIHNRLQLQHKAATVTCGNPHIARAITLIATTYKQKEIEGNYFPPMHGLFTKKLKFKQMV